MPRFRTLAAPAAAVLVLASVVLSTRAPAQQQTAGQAGCITSMNKAARSVAKSQGKDIGDCIKRGASGELVGGQIDACLTQDLKGRIAKASNKTASVIVAKCATPPDFGFTNAATVNNAAIVHEIMLTDAMFGDNLGSAVITSQTNATAAKCQAAVHKGYEKILQAQLKEFEGCKKSGLKNLTITSQSQLASCLDALHTDAKSKISGATIKLADTLANSCVGVNINSTFPGDCSTPGFADCAKAKGLCSACLLENEADNLGVYCDMFDNGVADASCVDPLRCGNGVLEAGEDCDDDNNTDGDCCSATCGFEPNGSGCPDDGNGCTDNLCDGAGTCTHPNNNIACTDGLFCTGLDNCSGGTCSMQAGDPCTSGGECADLCNESADNCFDPAATPCTDDGNECTNDECDGSGACLHPNKTAGTACTDDGNECTDDQCDGSGTCAHPNKTSGTACTDDGNECTDDQCDGAGTCDHPNNSSPCDDGSFCNGTDTCSGGACVINSGDPCVGPDGDVDCAETCDEGADNCLGADPDGSACTDDGDVCTFDECAAGVCAHPDNIAPVGCDPRYVSPTGSGVACSKAAPCSLTQGLASIDPQEQVRADQGTYTLSDDFSVPDDVTLLGGFDSTNSWQQTAGCTATQIVRDSTNPDGGPFDARIVALDNTGGTGFTVECLTIATDDAVGAGTSTYGVHLDSSSNYAFTDVAITAGNAADGASGANGANGATGSNGLTGTTGLSDGSSSRSGGNGGAGGGAGGGALGTGTTTTGNNGSDSGNSIAGGGGGGGGGGGFHGTGGTGGQGGGVNGGANQTNVGTGGPGGNCVTDGQDGVTGGTGADGAAGSAGAPGSAGSQSTYWIPGSQGNSGTDGTGAKGGTGGGGGGGQDDPAQPGPSPTCVDGVGAGGGGGGGGGAAGTGGSGGRGGGSSYAVYLVNNGAGGVFNAGSRTPGSAGNGGVGGAAGTGGTGGSFGPGGGGGAGIGSGGNGGFGGDAGSGGSGGNGTAGESIDLVTVSGTAPTINP